MGKLNYLCLTLLCAAFGLSFTACSDDDDDTGLTMATIVGTWDAIWLEQNGDTIDVSSEDVYMTVNSDGTYVITLPNDKYEEGGTYINTYTGIYKIDGNTIVGFTADRGNTADLITEYYTFTSLDGTNASISYSTVQAINIISRQSKGKIFTANEAILRVEIFPSTGRTVIPPFDA